MAVIDYFHYLAPQIVLYSLRYELSLNGRVIAVAGFLLLLLEKSSDQNQLIVSQLGHLFFKMARMIEAVKETTVSNLLFS